MAVASSKGGSSTARHLPLLQQHLAVPMISLFFLPTYPPAHLSDLPNSHLSLATPNLLLGLDPDPTLAASLVTRGLGACSVPDSLVCFTRASTREL